MTSLGSKEHVSQVLVKDLLRRLSQILGPLAPGFFLTADDALIDLHYNGLGYEHIIQPGGEPSFGEYAYLGSFRHTTDRSLLSVAAWIDQQIWYTVLHYGLHCVLEE